MTTAPERTFDWIRRNTPEDTVIAAELDGRLYLRTGRSALRLPKARGAAQFRRWLSERRVGYVLAFPNDHSMRTASGGGPSDPLPVDELKALLEAAGARLVFTDAGEGSQVWRAGNFVTWKDNIEGGAP